MHTPESFNSTSAGNLNLAGLFPSLPPGATALPCEYHTTYLINCYVITVLMLVVETMFQGLSEIEEACVSFDFQSERKLIDEQFIIYDWKRVVFFLGYFFQRNKPEEWGVGWQ